MSKIIVTCAFVSIMFLMIAFPEPTRSEPSEEIVTAAKEGLEIFLQRIPSQTLGQIGLSIDANPDEEEELGQSFQVYTVNPQDLLNYSDGLSDAELVIVPKQLWLFLVSRNSQPQAVLTVDQLNGQWTAVSLGASGLASQLDNILSHWPRSEGFSHRLIRVYQATSDFVEISKDGSVIGVIPLSSGRAALGLSDQKLYPRDTHSLREIIPKLKPLIKQNIEGWK